MLRQLNTDILINLKITAHQYIILILLVNKLYDHLEKYLKESDSYDSLPDDLKRLTQKSLVVYQTEKPYIYKSIAVQPEFLRMLYKDDLFEELYEQFPTSVTRPNGIVDYLRKDKRMCKDIYSIITKDDFVVHNHIMSCLKYELEFRKKNNEMQWMKRLSKWLSGREWENFEDVIADGSSAKHENTYGTTLE
jgi:hypothetical protein